MPSPILTVAWISYFPIEWLPDLPESLRALPRQHPSPWQRVLLNELRARGDLKLHVVVLRKQFACDQVFERDGVVFHCLRVPGGWRRTSLFWIDTVRIRRCLREVKPDLVHAWGTEDGAALVASRMPYPFLATVQGLLGWYATLVKPDLMVRWAARLERTALRRCRTVTAESTFSANFVRQNFPGLDVRHIDVVPDALFHRVQRRPDMDPRRFLFVGKLGLAKGGDVLVRALSQLQTPYSLTVIGHKDQSFMQELGFGPNHPFWSRTELKQQLMPEAVAEELARATLMICSTRADTGPLAVKEAAVAGVPVIGSALGGVPDYVVPGKNGLLFPSGDVQACTRAILEACDHPMFGRGRVDPDTLSELRARLSPERMARQFIELYQEPS